jgi:hypothetical protein
MLKAFGCFTLFASNAGLMKPQKGLTLVMGKQKLGKAEKDRENYPVRQTKNFSGRLFVLPFESTQMCRVSPSAMTSS